MLASSYIDQNRGYYRNAYDPQFVETIIVRSYYKHLRDLLPRDRQVRLLDFGCGTGTPTSFFRSLGMDVYGVDFSSEEIEIAKAKNPDIANHFAVCAGAPKRDDSFFGGNFDFVFAMQSLYYLSDADTETRLQSLSDMLVPGGVIWASMMASDHCWFEPSTPFTDGLFAVPPGQRAIPPEHGAHYINFTTSPNHLKQKFHMFAPHFIGYYDHDVGEGSTKHLIFIGRKP